MDAWSSSYDDFRSLGRSVARSLGRSVARPSLIFELYFCLLVCFSDPTAKELWPSVRGMTIEFMVEVRFWDFLGVRGASLSLSYIFCSIFLGVSLSPVWKEQRNHDWMTSAGGGNPNDLYMIFTWSRHCPRKWLPNCYYIIRKLCGFYLEKAFFLISGLFCCNWALGVC